MDKQGTKHTPWSWEATGAFCCFAGGLGAALLGSVLTAASWILAAQMHPWLHGLGTALLILTIPLLIFSGYCMDWMERGARSGTETVFQVGSRDSARSHLL